MRNAQQLAFSAWSSDLTVTEAAPDLAPLPAQRHTSTAPTLPLDLSVDLAIGPSVAALPATSQRRPRWVSRYVAALVTVDVVALMLGGLLCTLDRFDQLGGPIGGVADSLVMLLAAPAWVAAMALGKAYDGRHLGLGSEEFRRVADAAARFTALVAALAFALGWNVGGLVVALPAATGLTIGFRYVARTALHRVRAAGGAAHRVLVVGEGAARGALTAHLRAARHSGLDVVGMCRPTSIDRTGAASVHHIRGLAQVLDADTVAVAPSLELTPEVTRRIAWSLEGTGIRLLVTPALTEVAGARITIRPVSGLPLLQIAAPAFTGVRRAARHALDLVGAALILLALSPILTGVAVAVRLSSRGPVLFRQVRIGRGGREFVMYKFRSMSVDAEERLDQLRALNDHGDGVLFKLRDDPRITRVGAWLRRFSLDELPQLFNVLLGHMSLVGPRPPLPAEVARYEPDVHRRLLVKPGLTGLWQVSGRSDLDWDETVRLDLFYVENCSLALDAEILWRTLAAVLRGSGAR